MNNPINPKHYKGLFCLEPYETIMVSRHLDFCLGNYYKYLARLYQKDAPKQDFDKARWYMEDWCANHTPKDPLITMVHGVALWHWEYKERDEMPIYNPFAEKARIAFDLIIPPAPLENPELFARYKLLKIVTEDFIIPKMWRDMLDNYEIQYIGGHSL